MVNTRGTVALLFTVLLAGSAAAVHFISAEETAQRTVLRGGLATGTLSALVMSTLPEAGPYMNWTVGALLQEASALYAKGDSNGTALAGALAPKLARILSAMLGPKTGFLFTASAGGATPVRAGSGGSWQEEQKEVLGVGYTDAGPVIASLRVGVLR